MDRTPDDIIATLRDRLGAKNDAELARKLGLNKRTISSWKNRGRVPDRIMAIADGASKEALSTPPLEWGDHEQEAFMLALSRAVRALGPTVAANDYREVVTLFSGHAWFWVLMDEARGELAQRDPGAWTGRFPTLSMALYDDVEEPEFTAGRTRAQIQACFGRVDGKPTVLTDDDPYDVSDKV